MRTLPSDLRRELETAVLSARRAAENASRAALDTLGVFSERRPDHLDAARAELRNGLRAEWRQLGGDRELLVAECAYEQWHRLLFARFLAENNLLLHPQHKAAVTLADCEDLAAELDEPDGWSVAGRFAAEILPGIFSLDDPCVLIRLAPEGRHELEEILAGLSTEIFAADDALGWVYQFWQKDKKDEVNASERKIGGADLGPVTQLFTENYMIRFLLENSLGAWWASRHPCSPLVKEFKYLRFDDDGKPAVGSLDGWPDRIAEITIMDPYCGSGHFLIEAFSMLWRMRAEEEDLAVADAQDAVLRDSLFGLEIDPRCVQIAAFAVALHAWKVGGGWRPLVTPNIACSGIPVKAPVEEWKALADGDGRLENALERLHLLFREADTLGSLIEPKRVTEIAYPLTLQDSLGDVDWTEVVPILERALLAEAADPAVGVLGSNVAALGRAAGYLSRTYTLVITNVPYLGRHRQKLILRDYLDRFYPYGASDLAGACVLRSQELASPSGTVALVVPETLFFLKTFADFRNLVLTSLAWSSYAALGPGAFRAIGGEVVQPVLWTAQTGGTVADFVAIDCRGAVGPAQKASMLATGAVLTEHQELLRRRPGMKVALGLGGAKENLAKYAKSVEGTSTGDGSRYRLFFWEIPELGDVWQKFQTAPSSPGAIDGLSTVIRWERGRGSLASDPSARIRGRNCWQKEGVLVGRMGSVVATRYMGHAYDKSCVVLLPRSGQDLGAIAAQALDPSYERTIRSFDRKIGIATGSMVEVPCDIDRWRAVAKETPPLPEPWSDDPTQWLFEGRPESSTAALQVAVSRIVGYCWPEQAWSDDLAGFVDADGIVSLPPVAGEVLASDRVQQLLAAAFGEEWSHTKVGELLAQAGSKQPNIAEWLRSEFFKQHCSLFGNRPFVWHIWDGLRDGFSALVSYHRLNRKALEKLTYTYLGQDWVERQRAAVRDEIYGAETRLAAALALQRKLEAILEGEKPYDIYVRWKEVHEQPIGWEPDLNDGVRPNIRPFVEAGVLRSSFNIHWRKDRGKNPDGTERLIDIHLSLAEKRAARHRVGLT
jgi:hypothetical protein